MASKGKTAQPAQNAQDYDPIVAQTQRELKQQGYFPFEIDGKAGQKTSDAIKARDAKKASDEAASLRRLELEQSGKKIDAESAASKVETERKQRYSDQSASPEGVAAKVAANSLAPIVGTVGGLYGGSKINAAMDSSQVSRNSALSGVAGDRVRGLTTMEGARQGARLSGSMPMTNPLLRTVGRMSPHLALGGLSIGKGMEVLANENPNGEYYPEQVDRGLGLGYLGVGGGLIKQGIRYSNAPGVAADARSIAIINSNGLKRNALLPANAPDVTDPAALPSPAAPAPAAAPRPDTHAGMRAQAQALKIPGRSGMNKAQLANAIADAIKEQGSTRAKRVPKVTGMAGPALAAGLAYAATPDQAQAADGSEPGVNADALENAAAAGGVAYGMQRGIEAMPAAVGGAVRATGAGLAPSNIDAMTDYSPDDMATAANWQARNLPSWARSEGVENAYQMAQVPEPSPVRQEDGGSFDDHMAELQSLLQQIGQGQDADPMANAAASQQVASMPAPAPQAWAQAYPQNRLMANR